MQAYQRHNLVDYFKVEFHAMASPCELLLYSQDQALVDQLGNLATSETQRFESKFSRYRENNLCWQLNHSHGQPVVIDDETFGLLEYANQMYQLSDGKFDITSGVLRKIWQFKPGAKPPPQSKIDTILPLIGFEKLDYDRQHFQMPANMEIDFGGIGKEYCVDRVANLISEICRQHQISFLVNFGGDLVAANFDAAHPPWKVGLESVKKVDDTAAVIEVSQGAIATSGSTRRMFEYHGKQYAHILNPKTGYPVEGAPRSVSVFAASCTLAGGMSSLAQLNGPRAEAFLIENQIKYICCW